VKAEKLSTKIQIKTINRKQRQVLLLTSLKEIILKNSIFQKKRKKMARPRGSTYTFKWRETPKRNKFWSRCAKRVLGTGLESPRSVWVNDLSISHRF